MSIRNISIALASVVVLASAQDAAIIQDNIQTCTVTGNRNTTKNTSNQNASSTIMSILLFIAGVFTRKVSSLIGGDFSFHRSAGILSESSSDYFVACSE
jgi:uncharacterized membrane protein